ncbi:hypothetical protein ABKV19_025704 [Rosa sericea]
MKSLHIVLFCFLITVLYLSSHIMSSSSLSLSILPGRQPMRKLSMSLTNKKHENPKIKVIDGDSETSMVQENPVSNKYASINSNIDDIVYQIDYHGVTTHPTPTPRHSKP